MPIFYRKAIEAAVHPEPAGWLREEHLGDWVGLAEALDRLTLEQRCDAIYADWLLQLHSPAHQALLQIRNLLIGQGALAANYLAELAQNADDAATSDGAEVHIVLDRDWLMVANNGRQVTSLNLLGLSRFFVHAAEKIRELNAETIGRFGIGFKSSYRIASEVLVHTWKGDDVFTFRLPICRESEPASHPKDERLKHLLGRLAAVGVNDVESAFGDINSLGYCTPEYVAALPADLLERTTNQREFKQGTLFCFHLRPEVLAEVQQRISGQAHEIYELCPLFLPKVRVVGLGPNSIKMSVGRRSKANDLPNAIESDKITLTTNALGQAQSHSRFWRLRGIAGGDLWQVALHADSGHQLKLGKENDEQGVTLKDGAAYAFFPLNAVSWPFRFHLHVKLQTNLARDNWNPADAPLVEEQLRRAIGGMTDWLVTRGESCAGQNWGFENLVEQAPAPMRNEGDWPARWASIVFTALRRAAEDKPLLMTLGGQRVCSGIARHVNVVARQAAAESWARLKTIKDLGVVFPAFVSKAADVLGVEAATPDEVGEAFALVLSNAAIPINIRQAAMLAYLSTTRHSGSSLENALKNAVVELADGSTMLVGTLMADPCGTELEPGWHECFERLSNWAADADWRSNHVFGQRVDEQFHKLSQPTFNPPWAQIGVQLKVVESWKIHGGQFWKNKRHPCPAELRGSVLTFLHVPDGQDNWLPLEGLWLEDDTPVNCFAGLLASWPLRYAETERKRITNLLREWGLFEEWERTTKSELSEKLPNALTRQLTEHASGDAFATVFDKLFEDARRPLDGSWKHVIEVAEKTAVSRFVQARVKEDDLTSKTLLSGSISVSSRAAFSMLKLFTAAPPWLTELAYQRICRLGLQEKLGFEFLSQQEFLKHREKFARELLEEFHQWPAGPFNETQIMGIDGLCSPTSLTQRRDWQIGLGPQKQRRLRDLIAAGIVKGETSDAEKLSQRLLDKADWQGQPLPAELAQVPSVAEACIQPAKLEAETKHGILTPLDSEQLAPETLALPEIVGILGSGAFKLFGSPKPLNIKWRYDGEIVATLDSAEYVLEPDRLIVHQFRPPADEHQCQRILDVFETNTIASADYQADAALPVYDRYQKHRDTIRRTLLKELVSKVGYEKHHILRELLQNAESAYASKQDKPPEAWFEFIVGPAAGAGRRKVSARHAGRGFNEPDNKGHSREDVDRIWRLAAPNERTPDEVGRFNRGFKTLFSVATNGSVSIRSGDFDFEVIDLLMLKPVEPKPNPAKHSPQTEFLFEAEFGDALEMFRFDATRGPLPSLTILNPASFVFLGHLQRVRVQFDERVWQWRIVRHAEAGGWSRIVISTDGVPSSDSFLVFAGIGPKLKADDSDRRYAAAVRLGDTCLPVSLDKAWRKFRLTFETDHDFPLDFLVNGDFEADQGRVGLRNIARSGLVELAYDAVLQKAQVEIRAKPTKDVWLAWARILHLKDAATELEAIGELRTIRSKAITCAEFFTTNIPHGGGLVPFGQLEFPTQLLRRLATIFGSSWGITTSQWIDIDLANALPDINAVRHGFDGWLINLQPEAPILRVIEQDLKSEKFAKLKLSAPEQDELQKSEKMLAEKLRPVALLLPPEPEIPIIEAWSVKDLWHWWNRQGKPVANYTLEGGENWRLFYTEDIGDTHGRRDHLKRELLAASSDAGRRLWYRLFALACLMSAGRRMTEVRDFWHQELEQRGFWEMTCGQKFGKGSDALFDDLQTRRFNTLIASGEHAYFWRRVFYDIRKIHKLVWEDHFPETLLDLVQAGRGAQLLNFLKSGQLSGQQAWVGVFGQSAGTPLFFLVRELCRLGVIRDPAVQPLAYFISTPVRRAMERIGWIQPESSGRVDFESLASLSEQLHQKITSDHECGPKLLPYYDIPLLHLGMEAES